MASDDKIEELIREIAVKHGIAVGRDDPILILQTINTRLMQDSQAAQQEILDRFKEEQALLHPLNPMPYDIGRIQSQRVSKQFRVALDTNHYSVPAELASQRVTLKAYPDRVCIYHQDKLIARHLRSYDRHQDIEDPDHPKALLAQRRNARPDLVAARPRQRDAVVRAPALVAQLHREARLLAREHRGRRARAQAQLREVGVGVQHADDEQPGKPQQDHAVIHCRIGISQPRLIGRNEVLPLVLCK